MTDQDAGAIPRRLHVYNGGFLRQARLRRILRLAGHEIAVGRPQAGDGVLVWGRSPTAWRGEWVAARYGTPLIRMEDAFLRSIHPARAGGGPPAGIVLDHGVHFDSQTPTRIERLLNEPVADPALLTRAEDGIARLRHLDLSKYNAFDSKAPVPEAGFVLVVDQVRGDASIRHSGATAATFATMLAAARRENPGRPIVIKSHPETAHGQRPGHFTDRDGVLFDTPASPWRMLERAARVYTVSSQMGFEAILAGHRPRVFGHPFYAGWGLSEDDAPLPRRTGRPTAARLFAVAMIETPLWYDPCRDRLCSFETAVDQLEAEVRAFRDDRKGHVATGMRLWKRRHLQAVFGRHTPLRFAADPARAGAMAQAGGRDVLIWGAAPMDAPVTIRRVEDGFLRSRGLGADLIPPMSQIADDLGIYYDPGRESRLERLILAPPPPGAEERTTRLIQFLIDAGVSKYNLRGDQTALPTGHRILVPGQVEDDASLRLGGGDVRTNAALLAAARAAHPSAILIYKPHPDVEAGLRPGAIDARDADVVARKADPLALIGQVDEVWTMTSLLGFEALIRGCAVTCLGMPFYAGWGLTTDRTAVPDRRQPRPLWQVAHAALIAYPRYYDPVSRRPCPAEVVAERLASGHIPRPGRVNRLLAKAQGALAGQAHLWRQ